MKPLSEKINSLVDILQETLDTLKSIDDSNTQIVIASEGIKNSNNQIVAKLEVLNESINAKDDKDK